MLKKNNQRLTGLASIQFMDGLSHKNRCPLPFAPHHSLSVAARRCSAKRVPFVLGGSFASAPIRGVRSTEDEFGTEWGEQGERNKKANRKATTKKGYKDTVDWYWDDMIWGNMKGTGGKKKKGKEAKSDNEWTMKQDPEKETTTTTMTTCAVRIIITQPKNRQEQQGGKSEDIYQGGKRGLKEHRKLDEWTWRENSTMGRSKVWGSVEMSLRQKGEKKKREKQWNDIWKREDDTRKSGDSERKQQKKSETSDTMLKKKKSTSWLKKKKRQKDNKGTKWGLI